MASWKENRNELRPSNRNPLTSAPGAERGWPGLFVSPLVHDTFIAAVGRFQAPADVKKAKGRGDIA